ncbi:MAG: LpxL/LpxP family Kdo(2)-lipid IV(A) lauroyl/palmitoleoyl acyltransferase [Agarilytica sp.]
MGRVTFSLRLFHPKYWLVWLGFGCWYVFVQILPFRVLMWCGAMLGRVAAMLSERRSIVARKNIALCFPELSEAEQNDLFWRSMESVGRGVVDSGIAWFWPKWRLKRVLDIEGFPLLMDALADGQGVLLYNYHFTSMEIGLAAINSSYPEQNYGVYRPHANAVYEYLMRKGRERHGPETVAVPRKDVRKMVKALRTGNILFYLPDQDYGRRYSVFVPFMGVDAATVTAGSQLAKMGRAKVLSYCATRKPDGSGYRVKIYPPIDGYGQNENDDACNVNQFLEARIRECPEQYLWVHRRFKSRPDGQHDFYELDGLKSFQRRKKRRDKLREKKRKQAES